MAGQVHRVPRCPRRLQYESRLGQRFCSGMSYREPPVCMYVCMYACMCCICTIIHERRRVYFLLGQIEAVCGRSRELGTGSVWRQIASSAPHTCAWRRQLSNIAAPLRSDIWNDLFCIILELPFFSTCDTYSVRILCGSRDAILL